ncbi:9883_t:CDS:2, partial [Paraglomus occultum]
MFPHHQHNNLSFLLQSIENLSSSELFELRNYAEQRLKKDILGLLPVNLAVRVLMSLDPATICKVRLVSKLWNRRATNNDLWQNLCIRYSYPLTPVPPTIPISFPSDEYYFHLFKHHARIEHNWHTRTFTVHVIPIHQSIVCLAGLDDGYTVYAGMSDCTVKGWDLRRNECLVTLRDHRDAVECLVVGKGHILASGGWDKCVIVYDRNEHKIIYRLMGHTAGVISLVLTDDESLLFSGSVDSSIRIWDVECGTCLQTLYEHDGTVGALMLIPRAPTTAMPSFAYWLVSGSNDHTVIIWDLNIDSRQTSRSHSNNQSFYPHIHRRLRGHIKAVTSLTSILPARPDICSVSQYDYYDSNRNFVTINLAKWPFNESESSVQVEEEMDVDVDLDAEDKTSIENDDQDMVIESATSIETNNEAYSQPEHQRRDRLEHLVAEGASSNSALRSPPPSPDANDNIVSTPAGTDSFSVSVSTTPTHPRPTIPLFPSSSNDNTAHIFTASQDGSIRMWDLYTGQLLGSAADHQDVIWNIQCD